MRLALVGRGRSTRSAMGEGFRGSLFLRVEGERNRWSSSGQRFALRLRRRLPSGGPLIPLPPGVGEQPNALCSAPWPSALPYFPFDRSSGGPLSLASPTAR